MKHLTTLDGQNNPTPDCCFGYMKRKGWDLTDKIELVNCKACNNRIAKMQRFGFAYINNKWVNSPEPKGRD